MVCMQLLRTVALSVSNLGSGVLFYLAAAVSDFYVPWSQLVRGYTAAFMHLCQGQSWLASCVYLSAAHSVNDSTSDTLY